MAKSDFQQELQFCQKQRLGEALLLMKFFRTQQPNQMLQPTPPKFYSHCCFWQPSHASPFLSMPWVNIGLEGRRWKEGGGEKLFLAFNFLWHSCPIKLFRAVCLTLGQNKTDSEIAEKFLHETKVVQLPDGSDNVPKHRPTRGPEPVECRHGEPRDINCL